MVKNKYLAVLSASAVAALLAIPTTAMAADGDIYKTSDKTLFVAGGQDSYLENLDKVTEAVLDGANYKYEYKNKVYDVEVVGNKTANKSGAEFDKSLEAMSKEVVGQDVKEFKGEAKPPVVESSLKVESVSAINARELEVAFNKDVYAGDEHESVSAINEANYILTLGSNEYNGKCKREGIVTTIKAKGNKVVFLLADNNALTNGEKYSISVKDSILSEDKSEKISKYADQLKVFKDNEAPVVKNAIMDVDGKLKLTFDEFVDPTNVNNENLGLVVKVDGQNVPMTISAKGNIAIGSYSIKSTDELAKELKKPGTHKVMVYRAKDLVGQNPNEKLMQSITYTVGEDAVIPTVIAVEPSKDNDKQFNVIFDRPVTGAKLTIKKGNTDFTPVSSTSNGKQLANDVVNTTPIDGQNLITVNVKDFVDNKNLVFGKEETTATFDVTVENYVSTINNKIGAKTVKTVTLKKDMSTPKVASIYENKITPGEDNGTLEITFDRDIELYGNHAGSPITNVNAGKAIIVKDKNGIIRQVSKAEVANNVMTLTFDINAFTVVNHKNVNDNAEYTLIIPKNIVEDKHGYNLSNEQLETKVNPDSSSAMPVVAFDKAGSSTKTDKNDIIINYNEEMSSSAIELSNYTLDGEAIQGTIGFVDGNKKVKITLNKPYSDKAIQKTLVIQNVKTKNGSLIVKDTVAKEAYNKVLNFVDDTKPVLKEAVYLKDSNEAKEAGKIKVVFSENLKALTGSNADYINDFKVVINGNDITVTKIEKSTTDNKVLTFTLDKKYSLTQAATIRVVPVGKDNVAMNIQDKFDNTLTEGSQVITSKDAEIDIDGIKDSVKEQVKVDAYKNATDAPAIKTLLGANELGLNVTEYNKLDEANKTAVATALLGKKATLTKKATIQTELDTAVNAEVAKVEAAKQEQAKVDAYKNATDAPAIKTLLDNNELGLNVTEYNKLDEANKTAVATALLGKKATLTKKATIQTELDTAVNAEVAKQEQAKVDAYKNATDAPAIKTLLDNNELGLNVTEYNKLSTNDKKTAVATALLGKRATLTKKATIQTELDTAVNDNK